MNHEAFAAFDFLSNAGIWVPVYVSGNALLDDGHCASHSCSDDSHLRCCVYSVVFETYMALYRIHTQFLAIVEGLT